MAANPRLAPIDPPFGRPRSRPFPSPILLFLPLRGWGASKAPPESPKGHRQVSGKRVDLGAIGKRDASTDTSIIRQNPAKETSDHAEVGLGLGWHRIQSPTREGQKWSEGHSDVVRMQRESVLLAIPAAASPFRRGIASRLAFGPIEPATPFTAGHSTLSSLVICSKFSPSHLRVPVHPTIATALAKYIYPPASARMQVQYGRARHASLTLINVTHMAPTSQTKRVLVRGDPSPTALWKSKYGPGGGHGDGCGRVKQSSHPQQAES